MPELTKFEGEVRMLIDGSLVEASSGKRFDNINPATEEVIGQVADGGMQDVRDAIAAARRAFDETDWSSNRDLRKHCLEQLQTALESEREEMRAEMVAETGVPLQVTYGPALDLPLADALRWPTTMIDGYPWERDLPEGEMFGTRSRRRVWKEPVGVVGCIVPWNFPFELSVSKLGQALATGNTAILKPAPDTPWNGTRIGRLIAEQTDIPPGVVNVVTSSDHMIGEELVLDPRVDMISFTGSTATGRRILEKSGPTLKRAFLELGGKSAMVVLDDADLASVIPLASFMCIHAGQGCVLQTRLLVPRPKYEESLEILTAAFEAIAYGDPTDITVMQGPQVSAKQRDRVLGFINKGIEEGARLVTGGSRPASLPAGFFVEPTLFADVDNSMTIAQEEIFGPVLVVIPFDDDEEALRIANDSQYGLGGGVFSASEDRAIRFARRVRAGTVSINGGWWYGADSPYGGYKASGLGRQNGMEGFEQYLETKAVGLPSQ